MYALALSLDVSIIDLVTTYSYDLLCLVLLTARGHKLEPKAIPLLQFSLAKSFQTAEKVYQES